MNILLTAAIILLLCVISSKVLYKFGIPTLIIFLAIGMFMGSDGPGGIYFKDPILARDLCNIGLLFIIFSGGFGTSWETAKPVALSAGILATLGVVLTAFAIGGFSHFILGFPWVYGMLLGSIVSSTDAAAVFSILRSKNLNLKNGLAPMLEMESGSNDPIAYMLTTIFLGIIAGESNNIWLLLATQIVIGAVTGAIIGKLAVWVINHINLDIDGLYSITAIAIVLLSYSSADLLSGNGFLAAYITGLIMGNSRLIHKVNLVRFFDGVSWLMQIFLFFILGLLVFPSILKGIILPGIKVAFFIMFIARPLAVFPILSLFKRNNKEKLLVSWVGFRGAASIVFATYPLTKGVMMSEEIFNIVFFVGLLSVLVQGTIFVPIAKRLGLVEDGENVLRTFTDFSGEIYAELLEIKISKGSPFVGKSIIDIDVSRDISFVLIRRGNRMIAPRETTIIESGDIVVIAGDPKILLKVEDQAK
ncbi:MAG: potassium/proton antiporter [Tissierellales bacterium]